LVAGVAIICGRSLMALEMKQVGDGLVNGEKLLGLLG